MDVQGGWHDMAEAHRMHVEEWGRARRQGIAVQDRLEKSMIDDRAVDSLFHACPVFDAGLHDDQNGGAGASFINSTTATRA